MALRALYSTARWAPPHLMRFFGPASKPPLSKETAPTLRRAFLQAQVIGNFAFVQVLVQCVGFASGILLVRYLDQHQYAYFTIANTMQGTINVLADIGISIGLISIGGHIWQDRDRFGQLIATARALRRNLAAIAIVMVTPILYVMLTRNGASPAYSIALIALALLGLLAQLWLGVLNVVPRLHSDISLIQRIDFTGAVARLIALILCAFLLLNAGVAVLVGSAALFLQYWLLRSYVAEVVNLNAEENADDRSAMKKFIKSQAANAIFFCVQGQISIYLISLFGRHATSVAEVGALGRLAMIFTVIGQLLTNIFVPAFARTHRVSALRWQYAGIVGGVAAFSAVVLLAAAIFPNECLFVLGSKYAHLQHELLLMIAGTVVQMLGGTIWMLNGSKAWIAGSWIYIPLTIATEVALIPSTDFSSVRGLLIFSLIAMLPNLLVNIGLSYRGFRSLRS